MKAISILAAAFTIAVALPGAALAQSGIPLSAAGTMPPALPPAEQASEAEVLGFGRAYVPTETTTRAAIDAFRETFLTSFGSNPDNAALETRFPGVRDAALAAGAKAVEAIYRRELPGTQARVGAFLRPYLSSADCAWLTRFLTSPLGSRLQQLARFNLSPEAIARIHADPQLKREDVTIDMSGLAQLTPDERAQLAAALSNPAYLRFQKLVPNLTKFLLDETNGLVSRNLPEVRTAITAAVRAFAGARQGAQ